MRTILFLLMTVMSGSLYAQNNSLGKSDPEAGAFLKKVTAKYKTYKTIASDVLMTAEDGQDRVVQTQKGTIRIKGNQYHLQMGDNTSFSDGSTIYNYDKASKEIQLTRFNANDKMLTPQKLFTDFYDKDFFYVLKGTVKDNGRILNQIELTPLDKTQFYFKVVLDIDRTTLNIVRARIFEKNGNKYTYEFTAFRPNIAIPASEFIFNKNAYPGAEVIDLR